MSRFVRRHRWWLIGAAWVVVALLGFWGLARAAAEDPDAQPLANRVDLVRQLFSSGFSYSLGRANWQLDLARFLGQIVAGITFLQGLIAVFGERLAIARLRRASGHVVVCGLGDKGQRLAHELAGQGRKVVAVEVDQTNGAVAAAKERGILVVVGDATDAELLRRLGVPRANHLVAVCGGDGTNAEIVAAARQVVHDRTGRPLLCSAHLVDNQLCAALRQQSLRSTAGGIRLEFFNVFHRGAAAWLADHPLAGTPEQPAQVAVFGLGPLGQELVIAAAQRARADDLGTADPGAAHEAGSRRPSLRLVLVDPDATRRFQGLCLKHPLLDTGVDVTTIDLDLARPGAEAAHAFRAFLADEQPDVAFVTDDDDGAALATGLLLRSAFAERTHVTVRTRSRSGLAVLLEGATSPAAIDGFALLDRTCTGALVKGGVNEQIAQAIHADYVARHGDEPGAATGGEAGDGFRLGWSELPSRVRESNRLAADALAEHLAAIGCDVAPIRRWDGVEVAFTDAELDALAAREHDRWRAEREADGWTYGEVRDTATKRNPLLLPWDQLGADDQASNRAAVANLPAVLARTGFEIIRR